MLALGLVETKGLLPAIEAADVMLKTAQVELIGRTLAGGGLVTIIVSGDVGAVKAAVEAAVAAVEKLGPLSLLSRHVIPRPHQEMEKIITVRACPAEAQPPAAPSEEAVRFPKEGAIMHDTSPTAGLQQFHKPQADAFVREFGLAKLMTALSLLSVVKLRNLAREYKELGITGRAISKANKDLLLEQLKEHYEGRGEA